ncbi:MAG: hypothetical protein H0T68_09485, partial [Gemmatimonadales bacterium]|nr:hypothetical protein [Gemmatimonadales bacterium]
MTGVTRQRGGGGSGEEEKNARYADPAYAPAWARLGRVHRVMAKYGYGDAGKDIQQA